ncbi:MAG: poly-beta-1,6-N-acetyl-D-glucosamine N-deacetylase PgaB [Rhodospirillaceae bacterium]|nr:poly-beta-1,6-N-acetyl-D-glucosamine N-deacetylase PgaB [Rhodospirillales bacterium]
MLRWICMILALLVPGMAFAGNSFVSVCYHDVADKDPDQTYLAVSTAKLVQQFNWLRENGYHPVSIDQLMVAKNGGPALPDKAVLLTFDDGYISFYTHVFPLLKAFHFPATFALVGSWLEVPAGQPVHYGQSLVPRENFVTWDQVREMHKSGLVEIASHTWDMHHGILANPQGSMEPAVITRLFDAAKGTYEDDKTYRDRLQLDLATNSAVIARETGRRPRVMVWPYGAYNGMAVEVAREAGMDIAATLDEGMGDTSKLNAIPRRLVANDPNLPAFVEDLRGAAAVPPMRVVQVDLDYVYDPDPQKQEANVDALLERVKALGANTVFLRADTENHDAVYFPNRHLPVRSDLFNRVSWQLNRRLDVKVYAQLPVLDPGIYEDLARYAPLDGLLFQGDGPTEDIAKRVSVWRSPVFTARTFDPHGVLNAEELFAQNMRDYDYTAISAKEETLGALVKQVSRHPEGLRRTVFELQSVDRTRSGSHVPSEDLRKQMRTLVMSGVKNFGFSPDHFLTDNPAAAVITPAFSLKESPAP